VWFVSCALVVGAPASTRAQKYDFLLHPYDRPVATFAEEFDHATGARLIDTFAPTNSRARSLSPWMGSNTFIITDDADFGTGHVVGRSGISGDYNGNGRAEQADLDLALLNWGAPGTPPPAGWINQFPVGAIDQAELDAALLNWGSGDGRSLACLPWQIDADEDAFYTVQAQVWMPEKSANPNVTDSVAVGYIDNSDFSQATLEAGRGALWLELYYTDGQVIGSHDANYRVRAKDDAGMVELYDSADDGKTVDLSSGFATLEIAWKSSDALNWRMYGAAVADARGEVDFIAATSAGTINGALAGFDNQGGFDVAGVGFQMAGSGGMVGGFHAVPEPAAAAMAGVAAMAACGLWLSKRRSRAA
jgi:hypothetical protein